MASRRNLIVVANRGPVSYARTATGERVVKRGGGGLVTALRSLVSQQALTWIASAMSDEDRVVASEHRGASFRETWHDGSPYRLRLVAPDSRAFEGFYNVLANPTLWFLQHYMWGLAYAPDVDVAVRDAWDNGYVPVNDAFASAIADELGRTPDAAVFLHDYHLYLTPKLVRDRRPDALLSHFVHIPWPETDYWHVLPRDMRVAIHEGMLANDIVGLHTHRWRHNFLRACEDIVGAEVDHAASTVTHDGRTTLVTSHAISIDPREFDALRDTADVLEQEQLIEERRPEFLVVRVDRTDPSKNVIRGFRAFALFLERHPELHGRVAMLALLDPSRQDVAEYADYRAAIEQEAQTVNERFARADWLPVDLQIADNFSQSIAAYKQYDVLLVNPIFDGLNLVSKEAPILNDRDGVLILSENAGSHEELGEWALTVNPFDISGQAEAISTALTMAAGERRRRASALRAHVHEHDLAAWIDAQLADIDRVRPHVPATAE